MGSHMYVNYRKIVSLSEGSRLLRGLGAVLFALDGDTKQFVVRNVIAVYVINQPWVIANVTKHM